MRVAEQSSRRGSAGRRIAICWVLDVTVCHRQGSGKRGWNASGIRSISAQGCRRFAIYLPHSNSSGRELRSSPSRLASNDDRHNQHSYLMSFTEPLREHA